MASKPSTYKRLMVQKLTTDFRDAVFIDTAEICRPQKGEVCVKNKYVGINAGDVNLTKGRYFVSGNIPFGVGIEGLGEIVEVGEGVKNLAVGQCVVYLNTKYASYSEYSCISTEKSYIFVIPEAIPKYLGLIVCGLSSSIGLDKVARIVTGETVLVTAAAGGTGHIAVQWAKTANCHVIGTCSTEEKVKVLKDLGCDRVINYKKENVAEVLAKEYPEGVNVVWEVIGGKMFDDCYENLAIRGRLVVGGGISDYKTDKKEALLKRDLSSLPEQILFKSTAVMGFLVLQYSEWFNSYFKLMTESIETGKLKVIIENGEKLTGSEFFGMEGIIRAVEHVQSAKSIGKVIARLY